MITADILPILRCPHDLGPLTIADESLVARINEAIGTNQAHDFLDQPVRDPVQGGLVNQTGDRFYPIRGGIVTLLVDEAIRVRQLPG